MSANSTGMFSTLKLLYSNYGGWKTLVKSEYFVICLFLTVLTWRSALNEAWVENTKTILPTLTAFTIAAFSIFFSVLSEKDRNRLSIPLEELQGKAPLPVLVSSISHAAIVQIAAILFAVVYSSKPFPLLRGFESIGHATNYILSIIGDLLFLYGVILLIASILSVFRILELKTRLHKSSNESGQASPQNGSRPPIILSGVEDLSEKRNLTQH